MKDNPLKTGDLLLRNLRIRQVIREIPDGSTVLDIGCSDGYLFVLLGDRLKRGVGIDKTACEMKQPRYQLLAGSFPDDYPDLAPGYDVIVMAAVLEHVPVDRIPATLSRVYNLLNQRGRLIITIPSKLTDHVLQLLKRIEVIAGMDMEAHSGLDWKTLEEHLSAARFRVIKHKRFEFGLNHLLVCVK